MVRIPKVTLFTLGGTIASTAAADGLGVTPRLDAEGLLATIPEVTQIAELSAIAFRTLPSPDLTLHDIIDLAAAIDQAAIEGAEGAVVSQGTDTLEETAFALAHLLTTRIPVAVTGAMRNPTQVSGDGPGNLLSAIRLVSSERAAQLGCTVVFNDEIHDPFFVRKAHTSSLSAFQSPRSGPIGWISEGTVELMSRPRRALPIVGITTPPPEVAWLSLGMGSDPRLLDSVAELGYSGVIIEGLGGGHVPAHWAESVGRLAESLPVVIASRTLAGATLRDTYGFVGGEIDLRARGVIPAGVLDAAKARILLMLLLAHDGNLEVVREAFTLRAELDALA